MEVQKAVFSRCLLPQNRDFTCINVVEALKRRFRGKVLAAMIVKSSKRGVPKGGQRGLRQARRLPWESR